MRKERTNLVFCAIIGILMRGLNLLVCASDGERLASHKKKSYYDIALSVWRDSALSGKRGLILPVSGSTFASRIELLWFGAVPAGGP